MGKPRMIYIIFIYLSSASWVKYIQKRLDFKVTYKEDPNSIISLFQIIFVWLILLLIIGP